MRGMTSEADVAEQARRHLAAGDAAFDATLWDEALPAYEAALALASEHEAAAGVDEAALLVRVGSCCWGMSQARTAWRSLRQAMALYRDRGDGMGFARATVEVLRIWGPWERQRAMADEALDMLASLDAAGSGGDAARRERAYLRAPADGHVVARPRRA
jgi:hypothetical protein